MILLSMLTTTTLAAPEASESEPEAIEVRWDLDVGSTHRWEVSSRVAYPGHRWLWADRNTEVRAPRLGFHAVVDCVVEEAFGARRALACTLEDVSFVGRARPTETGLLQPVLEEMDAKLTGAPVEFIMREDGRVTFFDVKPHQVSNFTNLRTRGFDQELRFLVAKALAPVDFRLPSEMPIEEPWEHRFTQANQMAVPWGIQGRTALVHETRHLDDARVVIRSSGDISIPHGAGVQAGDVGGWTVFDHDSGRLEEAVWSVRTEPSPNLGLLLDGYKSVTRLRVLEPDEVPTLPPTRELLPNES